MPRLSCSSTKLLASQLLLLWVLLLHLCDRSWSASVVPLQLSAGAVLGVDRSQCPGNSEGYMYMGYQYAFNQINDVKPIQFKDVTGQDYRIMYSFAPVLSRTCDQAAHRQLFMQLLPTVDFILGGHVAFAFPDSMAANVARKLLYHCCIGIDELFALDMPYIFDFMITSTRDTGPVLKAMALAGVKRVAVAMNVGNLYTRDVCSQGIKYLDVIHSVMPNITLAGVYNFTEDRTQDRKVVEGIADMLATTNADALLLCDTYSDRGTAITLEIQARKQYLKTTWVTSSMAIPPFVSKANEYALTTLPWSPSIVSVDTYFKSAAAYSTDFTTAMSEPPNVLAAAATGTVYTLSLAVQQALAQCNLSRAAGDVQQILYNASAITCFNSHNTDGGTPAVLNTTGYDLIRSTLSGLSVDTFYGHVEFNNFRRNIGSLPTVAQIRGGKLQCVLPQEAAVVELVIPVPIPAPPGKSWQHTALGIVLVSLGCCLGAAVLGLVIELGRRRVRRQLMSKQQAVSIALKDMTVDVSPAAAGDGCGEGIYRGARVSLLLAFELLPALSAAQSAAPLRGRVSIQLKRDILALRSERGVGATSSPTAENPGSESALEGELDLPLGQFQRGSLSVSQSPELTLSGMLPAGSSAAPRSSEVPVYSRVSHTLTFPPVSSNTLQPVVPLTNALVAKQRSTPVALRMAGTQKLPNPGLTAELAWRATILQHPALCRLIGVVWHWPGLEPAVPVLVREWCDLGNLAGLLDNETMELPLHVKSNVAMQVADGMRYLHAQDPPILVGNLTAEHVLMDGHFNPKLLLSLLCMATPEQQAMYFQHPSHTPQQHTPLTSAEAMEWDVRAFGLLICHLFSKRHTSTSLFNLQHALHNTIDLASTSVTGMYTSRAVAGHRAFLMSSINSQLDSRMTALEHNQAALESILGSIWSYSPRLALLIRQCLWPDQVPSEEPLSFDEISASLQQVLPGMGADADAATFATDSIVPYVTQLAAAPHSHASPPRHSSADTLSNQARSSHDHSSGGPEPWQHEDLLFELFPPKVARALQAGTPIEPERYECVSIFFSDIVGYTNLCSQLAAHEVMDLLHRLYTRFDAVTREMKLFKVETIGDAYMVVSNLRWPQPDRHARLLAQFALQIVQIAHTVLAHPNKPELGTINIRAGLHSGPVVASVVGTLNRRYCLFGDTVNIASRMESGSEANRVNCSKAFADLAMQQWPAGCLTARGLQAVQGKGALEMFWVDAPAAE